MTELCLVPLGIVFAIGFLISAIKGGPAPRQESMTVEEAVERASADLLGCAIMLVIVAVLLGLVAL